MKDLVQALEAGKRRGYEEVRSVSGVRFLFQFYLKKEAGKYVIYVMIIDESKMDSFEDYGSEKIEFFEDFNEAVKCLQGSGADIKKFSAVKGTLPF